MEIIDNGLWIWGGLLLLCMAGTIVGALNQDRYSHALTATILCVAAANIFNILFWVPLIINVAQYIMQPS